MNTSNIESMLELTTGSEWNQKKQRTRQDGIAQHNVNALCSFQLWADNEFVGRFTDPQATQVALGKVLKSVRGMEEQITVDDMRVAFVIAFEEETNN
jgi:hypothetical protein